MEFLQPIILLGSAFLGLFGIAEILYHFAKIQAEYTRKLVHIGTGILTMLFPIYLENHWQVGILCGSFLILLISSQKFNFLKSINAIDRVSHGSASYPIIVYACFLIWSIYGSSSGYSMFYLPILTMAICDPMAALVGRKLQFKPYKLGSETKSIGGNLAFLIASIPLGWFLLPETPHKILLAILAGFAGMITEALSRKGLDNLLIPASVELVLLIHFSWS